MASAEPAPRERLLTFGAAPLRVLDWEGIAPTLVGWPGVGGTAEYFGMLRDAVPNRVIGIDPPGVGRVSGGLPDRQTLAAVWPGVLRWAHERGPVIAVGHSWGAYLARLALRHPELGLSGAILLDGGYMPWAMPGVSLEVEIADGLRFLAAQRTAHLETTLEGVLQALEHAGIVVTEAVRRARRAEYVQDRTGDFRLAISEASFRAAMETMAAVDPARYLDAPGPSLLFASSAIEDVADESADTVEPQALKDLQEDGIRRFLTGPENTLVRLVHTSHEILPEAGERVGRRISAWLRQAFEMS